MELLPGTQIKIHESFIQEYKLTCSLVVSVKCSMHGLLFCEDISMLLCHPSSTPLPHGYWHPTVAQKCSFGVTCMRGEGAKYTLRSYNIRKSKGKRKALLSPELYYCCKTQPCLCKRASMENINTDPVVITCIRNSNIRERKHLCLKTATDSGPSYFRNQHHVRCQR